MAKTPALYSFKQNSRGKADGTIGLLTDYAKTIVQNHLQFQYHTHNRLLDVDRLYMREADFTEEQRKAKLANKYGDAAKLQNIQSPTVYTTVEDSTSFLTNVFCMEYPMFKGLADPQDQEMATAMNTLIGEDQIHFGWTAQFNMAFRDGSKYNLAAIEVDWHKLASKKMAKAGTTTEEVIYEGNSIARKDPYNLIYDTRVPIAEMHIHGEYAGYTEIYNYIRIRKLMNALGDDRIGDVNSILRSSPDNWVKQGFYFPELNYSVLTQRDNPVRAAAGMDINWYSWIGRKDAAGETLQYQPYYFVLTLYCQIVPQDYAMRGPQDGTPLIWKLMFVNGDLVYAQPYPTLTQFLPLILVQPQRDGLDLQTKSAAENVADYQRISSALWNAKLDSARRRLTDRMLYNPLLIDPDHINNPNPSAKIPVRQTAFGRNLQEAVFPIPFHDENGQFFVQESQLVEQMAQRTSGHNNVSQGQFQKGNKLQSEFDTVMANAGNRDRTSAIMWEAQAFMPIKHQVKLNYILHPTKKMTRFNRQERKIVEIDPAKLREAVMEFQMGDGLLPVERLANTSVMQNAFNYLSGNPEMGREYSTGDMFVYMMDQQGVKGLDEFRKPPEQVAYEDAQRSWTAVAQEAVKAGQQPPPQPKPADYGWNPQQQASQQPGAQPQQQPGAV